MFLAYGLFVLPTVFFDGCHVLSACPARCSIAAAAATDGLLLTTIGLLLIGLLRCLRFSECSARYFICTTWLRHNSLAELHHPAWCSS